MVANSTPVILGSGDDATKGSSGYFEIREFFDGGLDHFLERIGFDVGEAVVSAFDFEAE